MALLVEALPYMPDGRGFDSWWCHWNCLLTRSFRPQYGPGVDSASNRHKYQEYFLDDKDGRCVSLTTLPPSYADCPWNLGASTPWNPQGLSQARYGIASPLTHQSGYMVTELRVETGSFWLRSKLHDFRPTAALLCDWHNRSRVNWETEVWTDMTTRARSYLSQQSVA